MDDWMISDVNVFFCFCAAKDPVVTRIEERIAAWTFLPEGETAYSDCLLLFRMYIQVQVFDA